MLENDLSLRKALAYSGSSRQLYYYKPKKKRNVRLDSSIVDSVKKIALERPSFGTRRMAAVLTRELGYPVNRKKIQRVFRALNWVSPAMKKSEIIRSSAKLLKPPAPNTLWEADMTYIWCGRDRWCYLFSVLDVFTRIWVGYAFDTRAGRENAIMSVNNSLAARPEIDIKNLTLRVDNGPQYRSREFIDSMRALGIKLEFIFVNTPEQNGHIESFQKTIKREYIWANDFKDYQEAELAIARAYKDYNERRPHSSLDYRTPIEFLYDWEMKQRV
jgi:transposase InsO family protein